MFWNMEVMITFDYYFRDNNNYFDDKVMTTRDSRFLSTNFGHEVSHSSKLDGLPSDHRFRGDDRSFFITYTYSSNKHVIPAKAGISSPSIALLVKKAC